MHQWLHSCALGIFFLGSSTALANEAPAEDTAEAAIARPFQMNDPYTAMAEEAGKTAEEHFIMAERLRNVGAHARAMSHYRRANQMRADDVQVLEGMRQSLSEAQRHDLLPDILANLVRVYWRAGNRANANKRLDELLALAPNTTSRADLEKLTGRTGSLREDDGSLSARMRGFLGMILLLGIAFLLSNNRKKISYRLIAWGLGMQLAFALVILKFEPGKLLFQYANDVVEKVLGFADQGASFLFGSLFRGRMAGPTSGPMQLVDGTSGDFVDIGMIFMFHVFPTIIFFGSLMAVLYHLGLIQILVRGIAKIMSKTMGTSGSESLSAAANIFVGQTEAPLVIKPYVPTMTRSELMAIMTGGMATVAGGVMAAYVGFGIPAGHLIAASVMSAPAALVFAKIMFPETEESETARGAHFEPEKTTANVIDAAAAGAADGTKLAINVAAMVLAFIALIAMLDAILGLAGLSLKMIFGYIFYPLSWCMGVDSQDLFAFGNLLGTKITINEFVAFLDLGNLKNQMSERSFIIGTYALCGFANFASIGIQIGGISSIAPNRRSELATLGLKAMIGGAFASWLTACIAGLLI